jgi:hypothetical protein
MRGPGTAEKPGRVFPSPLDRSPSHPRPYSRNHRSNISNISIFSVRMAAYIAAGVMGLKTAKTSATSRLSARNLKATEY